MTNNYTTLVGIRDTLEVELLEALLLRFSNQQVIEAVGKIKRLATNQERFSAVVDSRLNDKNIFIIAKEKNIYLNDILSLGGHRRLTSITDDLLKVQKSLEAISLLQGYAESVTDKNIEDKLGQLSSDLSSLGFSSEEKIDIKEILKDYDARVERNKNNPGIIGYSTGISRIDKALDGIRAPHLIVIAGYTSLGKSNFSLNLVNKCLEQQAKVAFYSLEMSKTDIVSRLLAIGSNLAGTRIFHGETSEDVESTKASLGEAFLRLINEKRTLRELSLSILEQKMGWGATLVVIDYIQNVEVEGAKGDYERMSAVASELQKLAIKLNVPIILVSQISNEAAKLPKSAVMGFKGSGGIAAVADFALELVSGEEDVKSFRDKSMRGESVRVLGIIKKNRHGSVGTIPFIFHGTTGRFVEQKDDFIQALKNDDDF